MLFTSIGASAGKLINAITDPVGEHPGISVMPPSLLAVLSWISPMLRAVKDEAYQVENDWIMDDSKYREAFGHGETPLDEAINVTLEWYRRRM